MRLNLALRRRVAPGSLNLAETMSNLATLLTEKNRLGEADSLMREVDGLFHASLGLEHVRRPDALNIWALIRQEQHDFAFADSLMDEAIRLNRKIWGPEHANVGTSLASRAARPAAARTNWPGRALLPQAIAICARPTTSQVLSNSLANRAPCCQLNRPDEAGPPIREAIEMQRRMNPGVPDGWLVGQYLINLAEVQEMQGHLPEAVATFEEALPILARGLGATHHRVGRARASYGRVLGELHRYPDGERELLEALKLLDASLGPQAERSVKARRELAGLYTSWGRPARAAAVLGQIPG
jgi:tetratricopeptide (TPR) repeat protein